MRRGTLHGVTLVSLQREAGRICFTRHFGARNLPIPKYSCSELLEKTQTSVETQPVSTQTQLLGAGHAQGRVVSPPHLATYWA